MFATRKLLIAGAIAVAAGTAVAVPMIASADQASTASTQCSPEARWDMLAANAPKISDFLKSHQDLAAELQKLKGMDKTARKAEMKSYASSHKDEVKQYKELLKPVGQYAKACHPKKK